jgi:site-specific DNA-methyltransferase (adenine-specific)
MMILGDAIEQLRLLDENSVNCIVTSPPYNKKGLLGRVTGGNQVWNKFQIDYATYDDDMPEDEYQAWQVQLLNECHRVLTPDGSLFYNHKPRRHKNRAYLPWDFIQRSDCNLYQLIVWDRRNSPNLRNDVLVPCTEHIYWLCKDKPKVFRHQVEDSLRGEVWTIPPERQKQHPAPFPERLVRACVALSTERGDTVLDPFMGSGTTAVVAQEMGREWIGYDIDPYYKELTESRVCQQESGTGGVDSFF